MTDMENSAEAEFKKLEVTTAFLRAGGFEADVGVILGSGLSAFISRVQVLKEIEYSTIPNFPIATADFHSGKLILGELAGKRILIMQGRFHLYEGYSMARIVFPVRVMKLLGIQNLYISNISGGVNPDFKKGDLVLIEDHINLQPGGPLTGPNLQELGPRYPDMSEPYSKKLGAGLMKAAAVAGVNVKQGVYAAVTGPHLETRAEYRMLRTLGADMVGMSTVPEVIAARHMGLPCCAMSIITDECDPDNLVPIDVPEIMTIAGKGDQVLADLFANSIKTNIEN
jgi:purine-nucleoside phosphorylase